MDCARTYTHEPDIAQRPHISLIPSHACTATTPPLDPLFVRTRDRRRLRRSGRLRPLPAPPLVATSSASPCSPTSSSSICSSLSLAYASSPRTLALSLESSVEDDAAQLSRCSSRLMPPLPPAPRRGSPPAAPARRQPDRCDLAVPAVVC